MAQLVWRYAAGALVAHLVYLGPSGDARGGLSLAKPAACGGAEPGVDGWRGVMPKHAERLKGLERCPACVARFAVPAGGAA